MASSFNRLSGGWWGKGKEKKPPVKGSSLHSSSERAYEEAENFKISTVNKPKRAPSSGKTQIRIDKEHDMVLVPSDGVGLSVSESESDDSDWSVGWSEPHCSEFQGEDKNDSGFAVLVPCYSNSRKKLVPDSENQLLNALKNFYEFSSGNENYAEQLLASSSNKLNRKGKSGP